METIIAQGAEAIIYKIDNKIVKDRISKKYRHPELDNKIRKSRTKSEAKIMNKLKSIINVPKILADPGSGRMIHMQFIEGKKLSEHLDNLNNKEVIAEQIGSEIAKIHENNIIHGDLTTSNMIYNEKENKVYFIDFGLGFHSKRIEDKAVDLHLLRQALEAKHFKYWKLLFEAVIKGYNSKEKDKILEQLKKVEARGRYKHQ
jgi:Kae1-associated kinase Bud32